MPVHINNKPMRYPGVENRVQWVALGLCAAFMLLAAQLWNLQVVQLPQYREMSEANRVWPKRLQSDRGIIYGSKGEVIADNQGSADIVLVPGECPKEQQEKVCAQLGEILGVDAAKLSADIAKNKSEPFTQILVKRDVTRADYIRVQELSYTLPGVFTLVHPQRRYLFGKTGGQLIGYLGEIGPNELETMEGYFGGDLIGRSGLEKMYEPQLHGEDGFMVVTKYASGRPQFRTDKHGIPYARKDSRGHEIAEESKRQDPVPGQPLHLTLDMGLQAYCEELLTGEIGAIVVLEADTGGVLALASNPGYDPSVFVTRGMGQERLALLKATDPSPMLHLGYQENFPPGSIFKIMMAAAALEEGIITPDNTYFCPGQFRLDGVDRPWHCWNRRGHGTVNLKEAIAYSCDVYFYNVGLKLGVDRIHAWSRKMGYDGKTGLDLPGEIPGLVPSREWKKERLKDKNVWEQNWYQGETINLSIGQGDASCTPLQNAVMMSSIINGGRRITPHLNRDMALPQSEPIVSEKNLAAVIEGMRHCVEKGPPAPSGTGNRAKVEGITVIGKTGSAQVMSLTHHEKYATEEDIPYEFRDHAWFVAGVTDQEPKIAMCILVEHGHHGSSVAAPLAKNVIEYFYKGIKEAPITVAKESGL